MVLKKSKYGYNTGRTLRAIDRNHFNHKERYATVNASDLLSGQHQVEISLNKKRNWLAIGNLFEDLHSELGEDSNLNSENYSITCLDEYAPNRTKRIHVEGRQSEKLPASNFHHKFVAPKITKSRLTKTLRHTPVTCLSCVELICARCNSDDRCPSFQREEDVFKIEIFKNRKISKKADEKSAWIYQKKRRYRPARSNKFPSDIIRNWTVRKANVELQGFSVEEEEEEQDDDYFHSNEQRQGLWKDQEQLVKMKHNSMPIKSSRRSTFKMENIFTKYEPPPEERLEKWLNSGNVNQLEILLLNGHGDLLKGKQSSNAKTMEFLSSSEEYSENIVNFLNAVVLGDLTTVKTLANYKNVHKAKHPLTGGSALHLSVLWDTVNVAYYLANEFEHLLTTVDNDIRTPLHYAIKNFELYEFLLHKGSAENAMDLDGFTPLQIKDNKELLEFDRMQKLSRYPFQAPDEVDDWIKTKDLEKLEQIVLSGSGNYLLNKIFPPGTEELERYFETYVRKIEAIHQAVQDGDERIVKQLLDRKKLAAAKDSFGCTPLHTAIKHNQLKVAEYLLLRYPKVINEVDTDLKTPLHYASVFDSDKREPYWQLLLKAGADLTLKDKNGFTAEELAQTNDAIRSMNNSSSSAKISTVIMDDDKNVDSAPATPEPNESELQQWFSEGRFDELEQLVLQGRAGLLDRYSTHYQQMAAFLDSVQKNQAKLDQIQDAIKDGNLRKVKNLIDRKKLVMARNKDGKTALHLVVAYDQPSIAEYLIKTFPDCINLRDKEKRTPLHYAAVFPDKTIYDILVSNGAETSVMDKKGNTAEFYRNNPDQLLGMEKSPDIDRLPEDFDNETYGPMREAPSEEQVQRWMDDGNVEELEKLVLDGRGRMIHEKSSTCPPTEDFLAALPQYQSKIDAIHKAVEDGDVRRVKALIDRPELALARDKYGATPIHNAVLHGQTDTIRYLAAKFPETVNASDHLGRTPLHYAAADQNGGVFVKLLQKAGGDAFVEDKYGHTPFYYRSNPDRLKVAKLKSEAIMDQLMTGELIHSLLQELEEEIVDWLHTGNLGKLEELVLNGYGDLLLGKLAEVDDKDVLNFLEILPQYQAKIQAIHRAIENGSLRDLKALLDRKKLALARDRKGATPLHKAVLYNRGDIATWLLKNYPQAVNALDHNKRSPLHYSAALSAADGGQMYKLLCKSNAITNVEDCDGRTPKHYIRNPEDLDLENLRNESKGVTRSSLQQRVAPSYLESSIQQWLREGNIQKLDQLVLSGCGDLLSERTTSNPEAQNFLDNLQTYLDQVSILHKSVREGDLKTLKILLEKKKMALARDRKGATPLHDAILYQQTDVVRYLVSTFAHVINAADYNKRTALHYAAAARDGGHYFKILEKAGADTTLTDKGVSNEKVLTDSGQDD